ncbi:MAG: right-handed parallel beta-helix repeat-containing protein [Planctomycetota bacterium]
MEHELIRVAGRAVACAAFGSFAGGASGAGPIDPPAEPVRSTMKPLDAIEPRICVNDLPGSATGVHRITEPGVYFLRADVLGEVGKRGIEVDLSGIDPTESASSSVVIELQGFSLVGVPGSDDAVHVNGGVQLEESVSIHGMTGIGHPRFSTVRGWGGDGIEFVAVESVSVSGVDVTDCRGNGLRASSNPKSMRAKCYTSHFNCDLSGVSITSPFGGQNNIELRGIESSGNGVHGVDLSWGPSADDSDGGGTAVKIFDTELDGNGGDGLRADGGIRRHSVDMMAHEVMASGNGGNGLTIIGDRERSMDMSIDMDVMTAGGNGGWGMRLVRAVARLARCVTRRNVSGGLAIEETVADASRCRSSENGGSGVVATGSAVTFHVCHFVANGGGPTGGSGLEIRGSHPQDNSCDGVVASDNRGHGVHVVDASAPLSLLGCSLGENDLDGLSVESLLGVPTGPVHVLDSSADANGLAGLRLSSSQGGVVRRCSANGNGGAGMIIGGTSCLVVSNSVADNAGGTILAMPKNTVGPLVDETGAATNTNPGVNYVR